MRDVDRVVLRARGGLGEVPTDRVDRAYRQARPLTTCVVRYSGVEAVNAEYAPDAHPQREALRWREEHRLGRTMSRSERRKAERRDRRSRSVLLSV